MLRALLLFSTACIMISPAPGAADLVFRNVRIVHGDGRVTARATVFVRAGRVSAISADGIGSGAPARREVNGAGLTLIPGLIDAHVHVTDWALPLLLRYGVTTVRDLHNVPGYILPLAREDAPDRPRIVAAGALIDGPGSFWKDARIVTTVADARAAVRDQVAAGAGVIKVYTRLHVALVDAIVQAARARGVPVAAHLGKTTAIGAARAGVSSIEHLSGIADAASDQPARLLAAHDDFLGGWTAFEREWARLDPARLDDVARILRGSGVVLVPTLALHEAFSRLADPDLLRDPALAGVPPQVLEREWDPKDIMGRAGWTAETMAAFKQALPLMQRFVAGYVRMGGRVVAGTDMPQQFVVPGASLHRELQLYVAAGLTPAAALKTATADAADLLGLADRTGTVAVGKDADLVLLDADPLANIAATMRVRLVVRAGVIVFER
jgi:imidazolonepropionase-like amidohydrolase